MQPLADYPHWLFGHGGGGAGVVLLLRVATIGTTTIGITDRMPRVMAVPLEIWCTWPTPGGASSVVLATAS